MQASEGGNGLAGELTADGHRLVQRVYYEDTDFSGVVYHARYLHFLERGRTDYLRLLGVAQREMAQGDEPLAFVVQRMEIDFRQPARMDDVLVIETATRELRGARLGLAQTIRRGELVLIDAKVDVGVVNGAGRARRLPPRIAAAFSCRRVE